MSNSFNISVKPEIAAAVVKIDANKTAIIANKTVIDLVHGTDVPNIQTNINANETKIDTIAGIVDDILAFQLFNTTPSDSILASADVEQNTGSDSYIKIKEIFCALSGLYRITFDIKLSAVTTTAFATIYRNGAAYGIEHGNDTTSYVSKSEDLNFFAGDLIQLFYKVDTSGPQCYIRNFKIKGTNVNDQLTVILDQLIMITDKFSINGIHFISHIYLTGTIFTYLDPDFQNTSLIPYIPSSFHLPFSNKVHFLLFNSLLRQYYFL